MSDSSNTFGAGGEFVGRESELDELERKFRSRDWVTVTGPPGVGKTTLAAEFIDRIDSGGLDEVEETWFVSLREVRNPVGFAFELASTFDVSIGRGRSTDEAFDRIAHWLDGRRALVLLDAAEHLGADLGPILDRWIDETDDVRVLCSSRVPIEGDHESVVELEPLDPNRAVELFDGLAESEGDDESVEALVETLDRIPLSIELAAAQTGVLTPEQLRERAEEQLELLQKPADDRSHWEATLRQSIERSWRQLSPAERTGLAQLSVFEGGAALEEAEAVLDLERAAPKLEVHQLLHNLGSKSLLYRESAEEHLADRFYLYEAIREFAANRAADLLETSAMRRRHARYFFEVADEYRDNLEAFYDRRARGRFGAVLQNVFAAYEWAVDNEPLWAATIAEAIEMYRLVAPISIERHKLFGRVVEALDREDPTHEKAAVRMEYRALSGRREEEGVDPEESVTTLEELASRADEVGDERVAFWTRKRLAWFHLMEGDRDTSEQVRDELLEFREELEDARLRAEVHLVVGGLEETVGNFGSAREHFAEAADRFQRADDPYRRAVALGNLANIELLCGAPSLSSEKLDRARRTMGELVDVREHFPRWQRQESQLELAAGNYERSLELMEEVREIHARYGTTDGRYVKAPEFGVEHASSLMACEAHDEALEALDEAETAARARPSLETLGTVLAWRSVVLYRMGEVERADAVLERAEETEGDPALLRVVASERHLALARRAAGEGDYRAAAEALFEARAGVAPEAPSDGERFYVGSHYAFLALRLFEHAARRFERRHREAFLELDRVLRVDAAETAWFQVGGAERVDISGRGPLKRIVAHLVRQRRRRPGLHSDTYELLEVGWPEATPDLDSGTSRVYQVVSTLRELGLDDILRRDDQGYYLARDCPVILEPFTHENVTNEEPPSPAARSRNGEGGES